ncbi:MAG: CapA family protein [Thermoleophilaceae bacterium]|nr:CapA family protein [Thermoleophilaceae bacterium]
MSRWSAFGGVLAVWAALLVVLLPSLFPRRGPEPAEASTASGAHERVVSISWAGDITLGSSFGLPPEQGRSLFTHVRRRLRTSELTLGNLEGALSESAGSKCAAASEGCFSFHAPPQNAASLRWAGFDLMNLANNHAFDAGAGGQQQTVEALRRQRVRHVGWPGQINVVRRRGLRIATVGFAPYPWSTDLRDLAAVRALVARARARADLVVVMAHLGAEGDDQTHVPEGREYHMGEDRGDTRAFAHTAIDAGADLVLGSGPHVLRGIEFHGGKLIAYSLGNLAGWHNFSTSGVYALSGLLTVRLSAEGHLRGGRFTSLRLDAAGVPSPDPTGEASALVSQLGHEDFGFTGLRLRRDGSF